MDAATLTFARRTGSRTSMLDLNGGQLVDSAEFRRLLVSHRRMVRVDRRAERLRGLQDLDTGEVFLIDEHRLLEAGR